MTPTPQTAELKVFEIRWTKQEEKEWIAARTNIEAIQTYLSITSMSIHEMDNDDEIVEIPREQWPNMIIANSDYDPEDPDCKQFQTFEEYMLTATTPDIIAGTMYE